MNGFYRRHGKRALDLALTIPALFILSPAIAILTLAVRLNMGSPVFFRQERPGLHGTPFTLLKYRTMTDARNAHGTLISDSERLTTFGRFLRSTSLDELPELWSVLRGEMSLVGPRPLLIEYLPLYNRQQARRHETKPGLTGWAQVNGRNALTWERKFELDVWYVDNLGLWLDLRIISSTLWKVIAREGISGEGQATMSPFTGSENP
jgi:lipopolysaccharide/colanic/teichoic acid biosynthesis glycosyltransferase